jgi:ATP-binding protein involved in chromosome partitioning
VTATPIPQAIHRTDQAVTITWAEDHVGVYPARDLRLACPCAMCVEEMSGQPLLDPAAVAADVRPLKIALVGAYAIRIDWSDGHNTGIYPYELLWRLCPCGRH